MCAAGHSILMYKFDLNEGLFTLPHGNSSPAAATFIHTLLFRGNVLAGRRLSGWVPCGGVSTLALQGSG